MHLSYGITGFYESGENPPPRNNGKLFKKMCFEAARTIQAEVIAFHKPKVNTNFFEAVLDNGKKRIHILMNAHYPIIAFAASVEFEHIIFYDEPALEGIFKGFYICEAKELSQLLKLKANPALAVMQENDLNQAEMGQIAHWRPCTVGELVFNHWS
ncbi:MULTISPECIES: hypothetical protein [Bacillaceae]|uniref:Uncharacterized protein n=1 Tax=Pseudobacillus wudalianchiensis TaxID=1743143 RepID=A0A1B9ABS1_9BACI|nr:MULTISPECIES: hypothetical protein [Bacillus]KMY55328.1 hypothetical protein AC623_16435 [Bacillus sp. FJAT-27231]OCA81241.1 hypothetical protein A8F95_15875 [Bacillus wudalianchiensis]